MATLHILLADGDDQSRSSTRDVLARQGYAVSSAVSAAQAMDCLAQEPVQVLVADATLAQPGDTDVLQAALALSPSPPVILLTDPQRVAVAVAAVRRGAFDYVLKPIQDGSRLVSLIERATTLAAPARASEADSGEAARARFLAAATRGDELNQLLALYVTELAQLAHAPQAVVVLVRENGELQLAAAHGYADRAAAAQGYNALHGEDFAWRVAEAREPIGSRVPNPVPDSPGVKAMFGLPLVHGSQALGVAIVFLTETLEAETPTTLEAIKGLTQEASLAVEIARLHELAESRNPSDRVTGLLTQTHFFDLADREFRRSWRFGHPIGALELDVDDFSRIQLLLGPRSGDELMQRVAQAVRPRVRGIDLVGRLENGRFAILVLMGTRETTMAVGERLRKAVAEIELAAPDGPWQVTASIGVAIYPREKCASVYDLFALANQATRAAKRAGRNRVVAV